MTKLSSLIATALILLIRVAPVTLAQSVRQNPPPQPFSKFLVDTAAGV